ncbi:MAG: NAD(+) synthase [bacterium]
MKRTNYGFIKVASAISGVRISDCQWNISRIESLIEEAEENNASIIVFPELSITGYTCGDLFRSQHLQEQALIALQDIIYTSQQKSITIIVGMPLNINNQLFNCAIAIHKGIIIAAVPKSYLPNYNEFYEMRWFASSFDAIVDSVEILDQKNIPFGQDIIIQTPEFSFAIEICEDLWAPIPPSSQLSLAGAQIIFNLSASNELIGKNQYLIDLIKQQSARCIAGYVYSSAGFGESSTDLVFAGNAVVAENGTILAQSSRFSSEEQIVYSEIDIERIIADRQNNSTFKQGISPLNAKIKPRYINTTIETLPFEPKRTFSEYPFVPDSNNRDVHCNEIFQIQVAGLTTRLHHTKLQKMVVGVSGGLDSTLALLVCAKTCDRMGIDRSNIIGVTMPGFGTTNRTYTNAIEMIEKLGATLIEIPIKDACLQHFKDIYHNPETHDVTYENSQARERTQILMDLSNKFNGIVIGTGDLSELALGWATYNGDHMSMYAVNASIPKTLIKHLVEYASYNEIEESLRENLIDVIDTPVSPELLPAQEDDTISQITEDLVGPYQLHDFFLYYTLRFGFSPSKIEYLAQRTFANKYDNETIKHWLSVFFRRFFNQQFKRSCMPDGPKVGSVCLSPRGDWRMPSDASSRTWLDDLK